jgi:hypothetical protein
VESKVFDLINESPMPGQAQQDDKERIQTYIENLRPEDLAN